MMRTLAATALCLCFYSGVRAVEKRDAFAIPLAVLTPSGQGKNGPFGEVIISYGGNNEVWAVGEFSDRYHKMTQRYVDDRIYQEYANSAGFLTEFEADQLNKVTRSFIRTLATFERMLQKEQWERCRYLDAYMPSFLNGFYYLVGVARNYDDIFPAEALIPKRMFDNTFSSALTDERVARWIADHDHVVKMRILCKELAGQLREWQEKELTNRDRRPFAYDLGKLGATFTLFSRAYTNR